MSDLAVGILGGAGRMGRALVRAVTEAKGAAVIGAVDAPGNPDMGKDLGTLAGIEPLGVALTDDVRALFGKADVIIDFTIPRVTVENARIAAETGTAYVVGTTGLEPDQQAAITEAGRHAVVVQAANFSLGVNLMIGLVEQVAARLRQDWDIEITEGHHRRKVDAPSGTALMIGEAAARGRGEPLNDLRAPPHDGQTGPRRHGSIGFSVIRGGGIIGDHDAAFISDEEILSISHRALDRAIFAKGALTAAIWGATQKPGLYSMRDVLSL